MKHYLKIARTEAAFNTIKETDSTLPIVASYLNQVWYMSAKTVNGVLDSILEGASGIQTTETNYVSQLDSILGTYEAPNTNL